MIEFKKKWKKLMLMYNIIDIFAVLAFYPLIPKILNYPPNSINNPFQVAINGLTYTEQYISILLLCIFIENFILITAYRSISKLLIKMNSNKVDNNENIYLQIVRKIEKIPKTIYMLQVIAPIVSIIVTFLMLNGSFGVILKVSLVFLGMLLSIATISYIFSRTIFKDILVDLFYRTSKDKKINNEVLNKIKRKSIKNSVIYTVIPLLIITIVFTAFLGYSTITKKSGDLLYTIYNEKLGEITNYTNINEVKTKLSNIELQDNKDSYYIIYPNGEIYTSNNNELSEFFIKYSKELSSSQPEKNRTYDFYAKDEQGVFKIINIGDEQYTVGIKYSTASIDLIKNILIVTVIVIILSIIILTYSLYFIFSDVEMVAKRLNKMAKSDQIASNDILPISSNDEISDLIKSFTNIQEKTNKYIEQIDQDKYTIERQAQFTILGEFAGGLAHDLNSPLSAVKLDISTLKKYINSDKITAEENVKNKLNEMLGNIDSSLNNMGNTIMGVRNQIRATGDTEKEEFLLSDVIDGIKILFRSIFMKNNCQLKDEIPNNFKVYGERNKLDRVIGNLIKNSIDAYVEKGERGIITVGAKEDKDKQIIYVSDQAGGIDEEIQNKIFKEIRTTKKEKGTGFGLYYSNTIIESSFKGKLRFETQENVGTTFYIEIPKNKEDEK